MTARGDGYEQLQQPDMERRLAEMLRLGVVSDIDYSDPQKPRVRVKSGDCETGWIPWTALRAGRARTWEPLKKGEQVLVASPSGDMAQGVIVGSVPYADLPAPSTSESETVTQWAGGAKQVFDDATNTLRWEIPAGGKFQFVCGGSSIEMTADAVAIKTTKLTGDAPDTEFTGNVLVQKLLSFLGGMIGRNTQGGKAAQLQGDVEHVNGALSSNGVVLDTHTHSGVQPGGGTTGNPVK